MVKEAGMHDERYLSPREVAERLGVNEATVRSWFKQRLLRFVRVGRLYRVSESDLEEFIERRTFEPENDPPDPAPIRAAASSTSSTGY
jgi:excisionase family DNA binding protein